MGAWPGSPVSALSSLAGYQTPALQRATRNTSITTCTHTHAHIYTHHTYTHLYTHPTHSRIHVHTYRHMLHTYRHAHTPSTHTHHTSYTHPHNSHTFMYTHTIHIHIQTHIHTRKYSLQLVLCCVHTIYRTKSSGWAGQRLGLFFLSSWEGGGCRDKEPGDTCVLILHPG